MQSGAHLWGEDWGGGIHTKPSKVKYPQGGSYISKHESWPIFPTEFGKNCIYILSDFGKQKHCRTRKTCILEDGIRQKFQSH